MDTKIHRKHTSLAISHCHHRGASFIDYGVAGLEPLLKRKKPSRYRLGFFRFNNGRDGVIRTLDPLHPMQVRYRAALRPDKAALNVAENEKKCTLTF